jgi:hypothetical protein
MLGSGVQIQQAFGIFTGSVPEAGPVNQNHAHEPGRPVS